jgi:hypothetical protein
METKKQQEEIKQTKARNKRTKMDVKLEENQRHTFANHKSKRFLFKNFLLFQKSKTLQFSMRGI